MLADTPDDSDAVKRLLPVMKTDVSLINHREHIVIECKYYNKILTSSYPGSASEREKLRSDHLRQIYADLTNLCHKYPEKKLSGLLLYAQSEPLLTGTIHLKDGLEITIAALDLNRSWPAIHPELLSLVNKYDTV